MLPLTLTSPYHCQEMENGMILKTNRENPRK